MSMRHSAPVSGAVCWAWAATAAALGAASKGSVGAAGGGAAACRAAALASSSRAPRAQGRAGCKTLGEILRYQGDKVGRERGSRES